MDTSKNFFEIYGQFGHALSKKVRQSWFSEFVGVAKTAVPWRY